MEPSGTFTILKVASAFGSFSSKVGCCAGVDCRASEAMRTAVWIMGVLSVAGASLPCVKYGLGSTPHSSAGYTDPQNPSPFRGRGAGVRVRESAFRGRGQGEGLTAELTKDPAPLPPRPLD